MELRPYDPAIDGDIVVNDPLTVLLDALDEAIDVSCRALAWARYEQALAFHLEEMFRERAYTDDELCEVLELRHEDIDYWRNRFPKVSSVLADRDSYLGVPRGTLH